MKHQSPALARLSAAQLKYLAAALMLIDHIGLVFFPQTTFLRLIGRLSMPIWCFFIAQGAVKTHSPGRYALRLLIFALVSEPFYDSMIYGTFFSAAGQNVGFTLLFGLLACLFSSWMHKGEIPCEKLPLWLRKSGFTPILCFLLTAGAILLPEALRTDYGVFGVLAVLIFYLFGDNLWGVLFGCTVPNLLLSYSQLGSSLGASGLSELGYLIRRYGSRLTTQWAAIFSFIPLLFYNGQRGKAPRWFFYAFYPAHMFVLSLVHALILWL